MKNGNVTIHKGGDFHWVGDGFPVRSIFGYSDLGQELSPFLLLDHAAPYKFEPSYRKRGVGGHPHRGFETVTVAFQGELEHRDSSGGGGIIGPGDVQWMTAASGLVHEEFHSDKFAESGGLFEMVQLWVNLPAKDKSAAPGYQTLLNAAIPRVELANESGTARIIAGGLDGKKGSAKTFTPINLWDVDVVAGKTASLCLPKGHTKAVLVLRGEVAVNGMTAKEGNLIVQDREGDGITVSADAAAKLLVMTGEPIDEPIVGYGPFVMNSQAEIKQAFQDYQLGKLGTLE